MSERRTALTFFADELRRARAGAGLNQEQLASAIGYSASLVAMIERSKRTPSLDFAQRCDEAMSLDGRLSRLVGLVTAEQAPDWFRPWLSLEGEATGLWSWAPLILQGLLQTEAYARAVLGSGISEDDLEQRVATRMERQEIIRRSNPPMIIAVLDEGILRRPIGDAKVMHDQLGHLLDVADRVLLQVVPSATGMHAGLMGAFEIATFDGTGEVVYVDGPLRGYVADSPSDVSVIRRRWEALRAEALPKRQSIDLIMDVQRSWN